MGKSPSQQQIINQTAEFIRRKFDGESTGHDWHHIDRVWRMAQKIGAKEGADPFVVELAALLHDIADWKSHDEHQGGVEARKWLGQFAIDQTVLDHVCQIVDNISFKGLGRTNKITTLEGKVVQDADRLDAIGAVAIARVFMFGGAKGRPIHNPDVPLTPLTDEEYRIPANHNNTSRPSIHHFYDKLLYLKDRLNTQSARQIAERRHRFMEKYLEEFFREWNE